MTNNKLLIGDMVSIRDVSHFDYGILGNCDKGILLDSSDGYNSDEAMVLEEELNKVRVLLRGCEDVNLKL